MDRINESGIFNIYNIRVLYHIEQHEVLVSKTMLLIEKFIS
jgi:hypothetical protein